MRTIGLGVGLIATVLVPVALLLFGALSFSEMVFAILLLSGLWMVVSGLSMGKDERLYYSGFGLVVALLSTSLFIPVQFTAGLVVIAIVALALISAMSGRGVTRPTMS